MHHVSSVVLGPDMAIFRCDETRVCQVFRNRQMNYSVISPFRLGSRVRPPITLGITGLPINRLHMVATDPRFHWESLPRRATIGALASLNYNPQVHL